MNNRNLAFIGAALLVFGLFAPIVTMPILGTINLFGNGSNLVALALLVVALVGAGLAARGRYTDIAWPGAAAVGIVLYSFGRLQVGMAQMRASLRELEGNPFAGLAEGAMANVQVQWGWIVLGAGAAVLLYSGLTSSGVFRFKLPALDDNIGRAVAGVSLAALLVGPALDGIDAVRKPPASTTPAASVPAMPETASDPVRPTAEEAAYVRDHLTLYDVRARYYDSMLDGRVPGVDFKIKNNGTRTLNKVSVRVVFHDDSGAAIAEEDYFPVLVSEYSFGDANRPLRPNYIWQQERGQFYAAKNVPTEWKAGDVTATITEIEFGPAE